MSQPLNRVYYVAYGNMIRYEPTLVDLIGNAFVICTNVKVYFNFSYFVEPSMNFHGG